MDARELMLLAEQAALTAYAPYSKFCVGAALVCEDGSVYTGCNIENAAYGLCNCAERTAIFKAVSEGHRNIRQIAVAGKPQDGEYIPCCSPCGSCRQVMAEFGDSSMEIILGRSSDELKVWTPQELLPASFELEVKE
ncbi:MAG: cytidine deaminase [Firmicutes bacterium]|nr:cytidine deaminase [Bacillota bacterium]